MKLFYRLSGLGIFFLTLFWCSSAAYATHIRAGEITARRLDSQSYTYEIILRGYADRSSQVIFGSNGTLDFGDGTVRQLTNTGDPGNPDYIPRVAISEDTWFYELRVTHTFPSARSYTVSFREFYRNPEILNMDNSVNMPFYIETEIVIDPLIGINNTPELLVPPIHKAAVGKRYSHNPGAYDTDGDSLSYKLVVSRQDKTQPVANYRYPHQTFPVGDPRNGTSLDGGAPQFTLDSLTGDLVWNTPGTKGQYNVAFYVEEWRKISGKYYRLGYVTRDMQIIVEDTENQPPVIEIPQNICVVAGERIDQLIRLTDPNGDPIDLTAYSGAFGLGAQFEGGTNLATPAERAFSWQTNCANIRRQPYQVVFGATDVRGGSSIRLTDIKSWNITVVAPAPTIQNLELAGTSAVSLGFNASSYSCAGAAAGVQLWRREGSMAILQEMCTPGMPVGYGYKLIDVRSPNAFPFVDNAAGAGLKPGTTYCYRMVVAFPEPTGGESLVSEEVCIYVPAKMPLITNASILKTSDTNGEILIRWVPGPDLTEGEVAGPHRYDLYRAEGPEHAVYTKVAADLSTTEFKDTGSTLNTKDKQYTYNVMLKDGSGAEVGSSNTAATVWLSAVAGAEAIQLQWQAAVPWTNDAAQHPLHDVYRNHINAEKPEEFVRIAQVDVLQQGFTFEDSGVAAGNGPLRTGLDYCYQVVTTGRYGHSLVSDPIQNHSQIICAKIEQGPTGLQSSAPLLLKLHPNPSKTGQAFYFTLPEASGKPVQLQLYDLKGQLVLQELRQAGGAEQLVLLPDAKKGMYLLLVHYNGKLYRNKLVVQ